MHVEIAQHLPASALHEEAVELLRVLSRFRWRLGFERTLRFGLRGAIASGLTLIGVSVISWAVGVQNAWWPAALPLLAALALGLARWPSHAQAALAADRRLALEERLGTAVELARRRPGGRFDALQVRDAVARARSTPGGWLTLDRHFRREAWLFWRRPRCCSRGFPRLNHRSSTRQVRRRQTRPPQSTSPSASCHLGQRTSPWPARSQCRKRRRMPGWPRESSRSRASALRWTTCHKRSAACRPDSLPPMRSSRAISGRRAASCKTWATKLTSSRTRPSNNSGKHCRMPPPRVLRPIDNWPTRSARRLSR